MSDPPDSQLSRVEGAISLIDATIPEIQALQAEGSITAQDIAQLYLARIAAFDQAGPAINAVISLNDSALDEARALDAERAGGRVRGPLHGVPVVLKDNIDAVGFPTTAGSQLLAEHRPTKDAAVTRRLRDAGAVIIAKVNLTEWASGGSVAGATDPEVLRAGRVPVGFSTAGGQTRNPHAPDRAPSGSSGGTASAVAAAFAHIGLGTDTGGSVRTPAAATGVAGLKPTFGLISRAGVVPLASSLDTVGPIARSVTDIAVVLGILAGADSADSATRYAAEHASTDYTPFLKSGSLRGARLGVARKFAGRDRGVDQVFAAALTVLERCGAVLVDPVDVPDMLIHSKQSIYNLVVASEFKAQLADYLRTTGPGFPKSFDEIVARSADAATGYRSAEKAYALSYTARRALDLGDPVYRAVIEQLVPAFRAVADAVFARDRLDALVYPTSPRPAPLIEDGRPPNPAAGIESAGSIANITGWPDLVVPAGLTPERLPVALSFFGQAWSEPRLVAYGYDFELATQARVLPSFTPQLPAIFSAAADGRD